MKNLILSILLLVFPLLINAQWPHIYNGPGNNEDVSYATATDPSGNIIIAGKSKGAGTGFDYAVIKYNSAGIQQWIQRYNGSGNSDDIATAVVVDGSGNIYVTGGSIGASSGVDYATIKYNSAGIQQWVQRYNGAAYNQDWSNSVFVDGSGNVYVTGSSAAIEWGLRDYVTIKYNSSGVQQWVRSFDGHNGRDDVAKSVYVDNAGFVYVTGGNGFTYATVKYDGAGNQQWNQSGYGILADAVIVNNSGDVYVTGAGGLVKCNSGGSVQWIRPTAHTAGSTTEWGNTIALDNLGNIYVTGGNWNGANFDFATFKYSSLGFQQWLKTYNGPGNNEDIAASIKVDGSGNVYVTGRSIGSGTNSDYATIKYNSSGVQVWVERFNGAGNGNDKTSAITLEGSGNAIVTGRSWNGTNYDYVTIKYPQSSTSSALHTITNFQPINGGTKLSFDVYSLRTSGTWLLGNSTYAMKYTSGLLSNPVMTYINPKFTSGSPSGSYLNAQVFNHGGMRILSLQIHYSGGSGDLISTLPGETGFGEKMATIRLDVNQSISNFQWDVLNTGINNTSGNNISSSFNGPFGPSFAVTEPAPYSKWISGEPDTIRWIDQGWTSYNVKCILNFETPDQSEIIVANSINDTKFTWSLPEPLLSFRSKIVLQNPNNLNETIVSDVFRIKPYLLTKLNSDSTYYEYITTDLPSEIGRDNWKFANGDENFWNEDWYEQFNYSWIDPFTGRFFPQKKSYPFQKARESDFPDWVSFVNAFSIGACYSNYDQGEYSQIALNLWNAKKRKYFGSCFGIALSNAMAFNHKTQFLRKYLEFPDFSNPHDVDITDNIRKVINELHTLQFGQPHRTFLAYNVKNTVPNVTLNDLKDLLRQDNVMIKMLGVSNERIGAHMIFPYRVQRLDGSPYYKILTYDNNTPDNHHSIIIDTMDHKDSGSWRFFEETTENEFGIILSDDVYNYFFTPVIEQQNPKSPFVVDDSLLQIYTPENADLLIRDKYGNVSGMINDSFYNYIPNSTPVFSFGGLGGPPYMFNLDTGSYTVVLNNFKTDNIESYFFTGNKLCSYQREELDSSQTDRIFFDGDIAAFNEDVQMKKIGLKSIIKENVNEKVTLINSLNLNQNDSVKLININDENFKLISYGSQKQYELELNHVKPTGTDKFINTEMILPENSSHIILPEWNDISNGTLTVLEDIGNDGTIDDTLDVINSSTVKLTLTALIEGHYNKVLNIMIPDTAIVLLREATVPFAIADSAQAILGTKGKGAFTLTNARNLSSYYIVIKHRNTVETWSNTSITLSGNHTNTYSFVNSDSSAYGNNLLAIDTSPISFAIFSGDVNQDGVIDGSDQLVIDNDAYNFATGYIPSDLNGDLVVDASDALISDNNGFNFVGVIRP